MKPFCILSWCLGCVMILYINVSIFDLGIRFVETTIFSLLITIVGIIDFRHKIIPDKLIKIFVCVNLIFAIFNHIYYSQGMLRSLYGAISASLVLLIISILSNGSIGGGDIKFTAAAGIYLGWKLSIAALALAVILAAIVLLPLLMIHKVKKQDVIALGPFLAVGMYISALFI